MSGTLSQYAGKTILAVGAHPDDLELGMGGTLALLSRSGAHVVMAIVSIPSNLEIRRREAQAAADILGCELRLLTPDQCSRVEDLKNHELVAMMDGLVREYSPEALFTHSLANFHVDHKLVYEACIASQRLRYFDLFCYPPTSTRFIDTAFRPHVYVDISDTIQLKMESIHAHESQFVKRNLDTTHFQETASMNGRLIGTAYAEGLEIIRMKLMGSRFADALLINGSLNGENYEKKEWKIEASVKNGTSAQKRKRSEKTA